jgi:hypothetical protein
MAVLRFRVHAVLQMDERGITVEDVRTAIDSGEDLENRPDEQPYSARLILGLTATGPLHVAVRDNIADDEIIVETTYRPDPQLWGPDFRTRRRRRR